MRSLIDWSPKPTARGPRKMMRLLSSSILLSLVAMMAAAPPVLAGVTRLARQPDRHGSGFGLLRRLPLPHEPFVIAHRGASGYRPEHTLAAYELAINLGADYVETDLVMSADGVLIARHDNVLDLTTDVAQHPELASRRVTKVVDGVPITGWFSEDFTLAEIKRLRAIERIPEVRPGSAAFDGQFEVPTLTEIIRLIHRKERALGRRIGLYVETKHPAYFAGLGLAMEERLIHVLKHGGFRRADDAVFIESFEVANLRRLALLTELRLVQLLGSGAPWDVLVAGGTTTYADMATPAGLAEVASYADGVGPDRSQVIPLDANRELHLANATALVGDAHAAGLVVHPYTFRAENRFLPRNLKIGDDPNAFGNLMGEISIFLAAGVDGVFTDHPDLGRVQDAAATGSGTSIDL